jgi:hypothetical protein
LLSFTRKPLGSAHVNETKVSLSKKNETKVVSNKFYNYFVNEFIHAQKMNITKFLLAQNN